MTATKYHLAGPALPVLFLLAAGCDNVGRAFDPVLDPTTSNPNVTFSTIEVVPVGGDARDGRPKVKNTAPKGGGWPSTVPIVVEFTESINEDSVVPTSNTATDGKIIVRVKGTTVALPCNYDLEASGQLLILRPVTPLSNEQNPTYEVVLLPEGRDVDGVRFSVPTDGTVLAEFQVNQDPSFTDGRIVATFPRDNQPEALREASYYAIFDRPPNTTSITSTNFVLRTGGVAIAGALDFPLRLLNQDDPRVVLFTPNDPLPANAQCELVVDDTITFGAEGTLDFRGRTPFARFTTVLPQAPTAVHVGNPTPGFDDKINAMNLGVVTLNVTTPSDAEAGDVVLARIYGGDRSTTGVGDIVYAERRATVPAPGAQTVTVDFTGALGTAAQAKFDDGGIWFAVQMQRGAHHSGFLQHDEDDNPVFDVTPPTLATVGPPASASGTDIFTDLEHLVFHGVASEQLGAASLVDGTNPTADMFASSEDGRFVMKPLALGRLIAPRGYSLTVTDVAGNLSAGSYAGNIVQRGIVTGTVAGTLTVEAYDHTTLRPIADATVLVDPGVPVVPAVGQLVGTTDANGRATFTGLASLSHTVTIVRAGYHLQTFYDTGADYVSMPLRPLTAATATVSGQALLQGTPGTSVLVGNNVYDDPLVLAVSATGSVTASFAETAITPNRLQVITAFGGTFEPTAVPTFGFHGYQMLGQSMLTPTPPGEPVAPGVRSTQSIVLLPSTGTTSNITPYTKDFALATGLDTGNLVGGKPIVRATASFHGFANQALAGIGFATNTTAAQYSINATFGLPISAGYAAFLPSTWFVTEARDTLGRVSRHRALLLPIFGLIDAVVAPPGIPEVTPPAGPFTGSPSVDFADQLDPNLVPNGIAIAEVTAQDPAGRQWRVLRVEGGAGGVGGTTTVQFPDLLTANVAGLAVGTWTVRVEGRLASEFNLLPSAGTSTSTDLVLSERRRQEVSYARSSPAQFTVQ